MDSRSRRPPQAPPPPVLSRSSRDSRRAWSRSRSRSRRSPRPPPRPSHNRSRYQNKSRDRDRRQSPPPRPPPSSSFGGRPSEHSRKSETSSIPLLADRSSRIVSSSQSGPPISHQQSISHIAREPAIPIISNIMEPEEVRIPRRAGEGSKPIFGRDELKEAMIRRMQSDDNDENPQLSAPVAQEPPQHQRVVVIVWEPVGG